MVINVNNEEILYRLSKSKFRNSFHLKEKDKIIVVPTTKVKVGDIVVVKEGERVPLDGTITKGNGALDIIAEHATATCCRSCLYKWHKIKKDKELNDKEIDFIVNLIMDFIIEEMNNDK